MPTPSFFSPKLVGSTKQKDVFDPKYQINNIKPPAMNPDLIDCYYSENYNSYQQEYQIPTYAVNRESYLTQEKVVPLPDEPLSLLGSINNTKIWISMPVHSMQLIYKGKYDNRYLAKVCIVYEPTIWIQNNSQMIFKHRKTWQPNESMVVKGYTTNPKAWFINTLSNLNYKFNYLNRLDDWFKNYSLADTLTWQSNILSEHLAEIAKPYIANNNWGKKTLSNLANCHVPLATYQKLYTLIYQSNININRTKDLVLSNEYLVLVANLEYLHKTGNQLPTVPVIPFNTNDYNPQQLAAVESTAPLNLLQSVAGSGKSHTILGRVNYLLQHNIIPDKITVLSFTNAAADHITNSVNANINSMTIAKMLHEIYQNNLKHTLSNIPTLINSISLYFDVTNPVVYDFIAYLRMLERDEKQAQTKVMHFIDENYQTVVQILNTVNQTTLQLEEIFCYLNTASWQDPFNTKYLIVDEVQDTSIFQFIYLLHYATIKKLNIFFVGDASQTLYAFRDADPNALNALEKTGFFKLLKLETNYRSNPAILYFANKMLDTINANQYAHLQLHANGYNSKGQSQNYPNLNKQGFTNNVHYLDSKLTSSKDITANTLAVMYKIHLQQYLFNNLERHEKTAFLGYTQREAQNAKDALKLLYPNKNIVVLSSNRNKISNVLSSYLSRYNREMDFIPSVNYVYILEKAIKAKVATLNVTDDDFDVEQLFKQLIPQLTQYWNVMYQKWREQRITHDQLIGSIKSYLLQFEVQYNLANQEYFDNQAEENAEKIKNADFVIATIHATKGLEFDNTVITMTNTSYMTQEQRRLYYVALTRAKKSEYLIEVTKNNKIINNVYQECLKELQ